VNTPDTPTPRTDGYCSDGWTGDAICVSADFARQLERELTAAKAQLQMTDCVLAAESKQLEHTKDELALLRKRVEAADGLAFVLGDAVINAIESTGLAFVGMDIRAKRAAYRATEGKK